MNADSYRTICHDAGCASFLLKEKRRYLINAANAKARLPIAITQVLALHQAGHASFPCLLNSKSRWLGLILLPS